MSRDQRIDQSATSYCFANSKQFAEQLIWWRHTLVRPSVLYSLLFQNTLSIWYSFDFSMEINIGFWYISKAWNLVKSRLYKNYKYATNWNLCIHCAQLSAHWPKLWQKYRIWCPLHASFHICQFWAKIKVAKGLCTHSGLWLFFTFLVFVVANLVITAQCTLHKT